LINTIVRGLGGLGSSALGLGPGIGSAAADGAHRLFKSVTGFGDYKVNSNTLMTNNGAPIFKASDRVFKIRHREFICDLKSGNFLDGTATVYSDARTGIKSITPRAPDASMLINPGNSELFPWLSSIAKRFQQYRFRGLLFSFEGRSGTAVGSTNTALGTIIFSTNYNSSQKIFSSKQEAESHEFTTSCLPSSSMLHPIECSPKEQVLEHLYVQQGDKLEPGEDPKMYHLGTFQPATQGMQLNNVNLGELWVTYDIEFLKPAIAGKEEAFESHLLGAVGAGVLPPIVSPTPYVSLASVVIDAPGGLIIFDSSLYGQFILTMIISGPNAASIVGTTTLVASGNAKLELALDNDTVDSYSVVDSTGQFSTATCVVSLQGGGLITVNPNFANNTDIMAVDIYFNNLPY